MATYCVEVQDWQPSGDRLAPAVARTLTVEVDDEAPYSEVVAAARLHIDGLMVAPLGQGWRIVSACRLQP